MSFTKPLCVTVTTNNQKKSSRKLFTVSNAFFRQIEFSLNFFFGLTSDGLFDTWLNDQLPVPIWTPLILPDEFLSEELSPQSPTPTEDGPRNNNNYDDTDNEDSNKSSATSTPSNTVSLTIPTHPGCRGGHQMVMDSVNQVRYCFGHNRGSEIYFAPTSIVHS